LNVRDPLAATHALQAQGWPPFGVVWDEPGSVFYAAKPSPALPAGLWVISDRKPGQPTAALSCFGHYPAGGYQPMVEAIERRWGPSQAGPSTYPSSRAWAFRMTNGAFARLQMGAPTAAALAQLRPGEALVHAQVFYNAPYHDVASAVSVSRLAP
jgi:hypothetical protein